jgi:hypothetical protein
MICSREVGWTIVSNTTFHQKFGGEGMTVGMDETFLKSKKDGRGRPSPSSKVEVEELGRRFPNNLPSLKDYPELLDIPDLIIPHDAPQDDSHSSSESDSDSTIIHPHDVDSDDTVIRSG